MFVTIILYLVLLVEIVFLVFSWPKLRRRLHAIELIAIIMFASVMLQQSIYIIDINLNLKDISEQPMDVTMMRISQIIIFPMIIAWHFYYMTNVKRMQGRRLLSLLICALVLSFITFLFKSLGYLHYTGWKGLYNILAYAGILILTEMFDWLLQLYPLRKNGGSAS
ncbi:hypothetical protein GQF01_06510 [Paenibacillus sp. 5J-6]|uniref:Uncharacterized protein n=1 Tax=Paenibacillus silvestris TaxID=2606219 RepID=A0A6L8UUI8_9BACL|nr:hypothetical protein [Paenibacillus silvestris]MZQ81785.1 hypothetical protein [Paenibacillus silvestris]